MNVVDLRPVRLVRRLLPGESGAPRLERLVAALRELAQCEPVRADVLAVLAGQGRVAVEADHSAVWISLGDQMTAVAESGDATHVQGEVYGVSDSLAGRTLTSGE